MSRNREDNKDRKKRGIVFGERRQTTSKRKIGTRTILFVRYDFYSSSTLTNWIRFDLCFLLSSSSSIITLDSCFSLLFIIIMIHVTIGPPIIEIEDPSVIVPIEPKNEIRLPIHGGKQFRPQPRSNLYHR